jgi:hypothetical protein
MADQIWHHRATLLEYAEDEHSGSHFSKRSHQFGEDRCIHHRGQNSSSMAVELDDLSEKTSCPIPTLPWRGLTTDIRTRVSFCLCICRVGLRLPCGHGNVQCKQSVRPPLQGHTRTRDLPVPFGSQHTPASHEKGACGPALSSVPRCASRLMRPHDQDLSLDGM